MKWTIVRSSPAIGATIPPWRFRTMAATSPRTPAVRSNYDLDMAERIGKVSSVERGKQQIAVCAYCNANEQLAELSVKAAKAVMRRKGWRKTAVGWVCAQCYSVELA